MLTIIFPWGVAYEGTTHRKSGLKRFNELKDKGYKVIYTYVHDEGWNGHEGPFMELIAYTK